MPVKDKAIIKDLADFTQKQTIPCTGHVAQ